MDFLNNIKTNKLTPPKPRAHSENRTCRICQLEKPLQEYQHGRYNQYKPADYCQDCKPVIQHLSNYQRHHRRIRRNRQKRYGITDHYDALEWCKLVHQHNYTCLACGLRSKRKLTADHIQPLSQGGHSRITNIQPLCWNCNQEKGNQFIDYRGKQ